MAFDPGFRGGIYVAAGNQDRGDVTGDGRPDIVVSTGTGGNQVKVFSGADFQLFFSFVGFGGDFTGGLRVGLIDANGDGRSDVIVGAGPGQGALVRLVNLAGNQNDLEFFQAYTPLYLGGVFVAGS